MNRRFVIRGLILSGAIGAQTAWLLGANHRPGLTNDAAWWLSFALHFPAALVESHFRPGSGIVLVLIIADCLLWGFTIAWLSVWLQRKLLSLKRTDAVE